MIELDKAYNAEGTEDRIYDLWLKSNYFNPDKLPGNRTEVFTIMLPPPNVTGTLHVGHALMLVIEDIMIRQKRMAGFKTLWLPGTDHASIATQSKVEKILEKEEGKRKTDLGREVFLERVEKFAQESHDTIVNQVKKMGASVDWSREAYTLDEARSKAVRTAFKNMYDTGLIYQGNRMVNWDPKGQTVISDDEVVYEEEKTKFYYFKYGPFTIGTARPETKFGDKYVVVHPDDKRYAEFHHGQQLELEWINGPMKATVIKDEAIDMEFGTGAMTITPWHSQVDFEMAQKHGLDMEQIIDQYGKLLPIAGEFAGKKISEARQLIVEKLRAKGLVVKEEEYTHNVAKAERTSGIIEPQIMKQWFIDVNREFAMPHSEIPGIATGDIVTLKHLMRHTVEQGAIKIIPEFFDKTYFHWIDNLKDWCISRQIWYGHRIPVWYKDQEIHCDVQPPKGDGWKQDEDTLDTWFSAGLWTFSTLGWPEQTEDYKTYHPTTVLETGYDILFFWVARMILMTTYHTGQVPFKNVYLHGLVRDAQRQKMSKSKGNIIDPLDMIAKYGTDALRFSLIFSTAPGTDIAMAEDKIKGMKNFANKLWNIARYVLATPDLKMTDKKPDAQTDADKNILQKLEEATIAVNKGFETYNLHEAAQAIYQFTWHEFADLYIEASKEQLKDEALADNTKQILLYCLVTSLKLLHPFMPFITEELWGKLREAKLVTEDNLLLVATWPK